MKKQIIQFQLILLITIYITGCMHFGFSKKKPAPLEYPKIETKALLHGLDSLDPLERLNSVKKLGKLKISSDNSKVKGMLTNGTVSEKLLLVNKIGRRGKKISKVIDPLKLCLNDIKPETKIEAARSLKSINNELYQFIPVLSSLASLKSSKKGNEIVALKKSASFNFKNFLALTDKISKGFSEHLNDDDKTLNEFADNLIKENKKKHTAIKTPEPSGQQKILKKTEKSEIKQESEDESESEIVAEDELELSAEQWAEKLDSFNPETRRLAAIKIGKLPEKPENEINSYINTLKNGDFQARIDSAKEIGYRASDITGAVYALCRTINDIDKNVRIESLKALGKLIGKYISSIDEIKNATKDMEYIANKQKDSFNSNLNMEIDDIHQEASITIEKIQQLASIALPRLIPLLNDQDIDIRNSAANAITQIKPVKKKKLKKKNKKKVNKSKTLKDDIPVLLLANDLKNKNTDVARNAARKLGEMGPRASIAVPAIIEAINDESNWHPHYKYVRIEAIKALGKIGLAARPAVPVLIKKMDDLNFNIRKEAAKALGKTGSYSDITLFALINALNKDPSSPVKAASAEALMDCDPSCCLNEFFDALLKGLDSFSGEVKLSCFKTLAAYEVTNKGKGFIKWKKSKKTPENYIVCTGPASDNLTECVDVGLSTICSMGSFSNKDDEKYVIDVTAKKGLVTYKISWVHVDIKKLLEQIAANETDLKIKAEENEALKKLNENI